MMRIFKSICYWYDCIRCNYYATAATGLSNGSKDYENRRGRPTGVCISVQTPVAIVLVLRTSKARKNKIQCKTNKKKKKLNNYLTRTPARARNIAMMILNYTLCTRTSGFKCLCNRSRSLRSRRSHYIVVLCIIVLLYAPCYV